LEYVFCDMRDDTILVLVDIPGINEAGKGSKYQDYVTKKWNTFDCVVLVMDSTKGVNGEEQVKLLEFVKKNLETKKDIPTIILCNKVDETDDEEQSILVNEARKEVERVFCVKDRGEALQTMLKHAANKTIAPADAQISPVFISTSAIHAFIYQTASLMTMEQFKKFDKQLIEKLGRDEVGKWQWKKLSEDQQYEVAHKAVIDQTQYEERLAATNFDRFLNALAYSVGDSQNQLHLIKKQLQVSLDNLSPVRGIAGELRGIIDRSIIIGEPTNKLKNVFWSKYKIMKKNAFQNFLLPTQVGCLAPLMLELQDFRQHAAEIKWEEQEQNAIQHMKGLIRKQLSILLNKEKCCRKLDWQENSVSFDDEVTWNNMSPDDWKTICRSMLLLLHNKIFCNTFGQEAILIQSLVDAINAGPSMLSTIQSRDMHCSECGYSCSASTKIIKCPYCQKCMQCGTKKPCKCFPPGEYTVVRGELKPPDEQSYQRVYRIQVPKDFDDPSHWGHIGWLYCQMVESNTVGPVVRCCQF